ncbi:hypothetical protein [Halodesulfovibrio aestuarii]|uniref:hypothetical protein n=1 Tax=Halodesulfovibrio aestuarii TaxID=126333 RepID=UPI003D354D1F
MASPLPKDIENSDFFSLFLRLVKGNADVEALIALGLSYKDIFQFTKLAIAEGFLKRIGQRLVLTRKGNERISSLSETKRNTTGWIRPLDEFKTPKKNISDIFIPAKNDIEQF